MCACGVVVCFYFSPSPAFIHSFLAAFLHSCLCVRVCHVCASMPHMCTSPYRSDQPLPAPPAAAQALRARALEVIEEWHEAWGAHYPQVKGGFGEECSVLHVCLHAGWSGFACINVYTRPVSRPEPVNLHAPVHCAPLLHSGDCGVPLPQEAVQVPRNCLTSRSISSRGSGPHAPPPGAAAAALHHICGGLSSAEGSTGRPGASPAAVLPTAAGATTTSTATSTAAAAG